MSPLSVVAPEISIVLPFHNEAQTVRDLFARLYPILNSLGLEYEVIAVDDGSADGTSQLLKAERDKNPRLRVVRLARNFGKEAALTCGLHRVRGRAAVLLDSDLQHPPEVIPQLVMAWQGGAKMVYAIRRNRSTDGFIRRIFSKAFYGIFSHIADIQLPEGAGDFRLLDRVVIDAVNALPERTRFMKGLITWVGFEQALVPFDVAPRPEGRSNWNLFRLFNLACDGLSSFSTVPLRIWTGVGGAMSACALAYGGYLTIRTLVDGVDVPGFASLMVSILFLGGIQLLSLGIIGEYLARVFIEVKGRPIYLVAEQHGFDNSDA